MNDRLNTPSRADRRHAMQCIQSSEEALDKMATELRAVIVKSATSPKTRNLVRILGLLHKASSHTYVAHATLLEIKEDPYERHSQGTERSSKPSE